MAITFGQKLREFAEQLGVCFRQHTAAHCKIVTLANKYDVYYGRRGYSVIPKTGLATQLAAMYDQKLLLWARDTSKLRPRDELMRVVIE